MLETNDKPKIRLSETIESLSNVLIRNVVAADATKVAAKITPAYVRTRPFSRMRGVRMARFDPARRADRVGNDGRTNRCL